MNNKRESIVILDAGEAIGRALTRIAHEIAERNEHSAEVVLVGIPAGGDVLARRLGEILSTIWKHPVPAGSLDVSMHRDDLDRRAAPRVHPTVMPFGCEWQNRRARGRRIIQRSNHSRGHGRAQ